MSDDVKYTIGSFPLPSLARVLPTLHSVSLSPAVPLDLPRVEALMRQSPTLLTFAQGHAICAWENGAFAALPLLHTRTYKHCVCVLHANRSLSPYPPLLQPRTLFFSRTHLCRVDPNPSDLPGGHPGAVQ